MSADERDQEGDAVVEQQQRSTTEAVFEAVKDLHDKEQIVTRDTLSEVTGLKLSIIDDRLSYLTDNGRIRRVQRGVYVPVEHHRPARLISRTLLPDGATVLEIGDTVIHLTPRESRMIGELMAGSGQQYAAIQLGDQAQAIASELAAKVRMIERAVLAFQSQTGSE